MTHLRIKTVDFREVWTKIEELKKAKPIKVLTPNVLLVLDRKTTGFLKSLARQVIEISTQMPSFPHDFLIALCRANHVEYLREMSQKIDAVKKLVLKFRLLSLFKGLGEIKMLPLPFRPSCFANPERFEYDVQGFWVRYRDSFPEGRIDYFLDEEIAFSYDQLIALSEDMENIPENLPETPPTFEELLDSREAYGRKLGTDPVLSKLSAYASLGILKLSPLLLDDLVEEAYLDDPSSTFYVDHRDWSRCSTNIRLTKEDAERLILRLKFDSGHRLDFSNPSLKTEVKCKDFIARFSVDIYPLALHGLHIDIRKHKRAPFTLPELISNGTISPPVAAYLYFALVHRRNITIVGPPNSGKTTLANALDMLCPFPWRRVYVEDASESLDLRAYGYHQAKFCVDPMEQRPVRFPMDREIVKLLHRSPDWVFLGEIQTKEQTRAMFHAIASGLRGIQTFHASSLQQLVNRWLNHYGIPPSCILDLDVIVQMERFWELGKIRRRVVGVCEPHILDGKLHFVEVFKWDPTREEVIRAEDLYETPVLRKIRALKAISRRDFEETLAFFEKIFRHMANRGIYEAGEVIRFMRRIWCLRREHSWGSILKELE